jgi:hypothetical protein
MSDKDVIITISDKSSNTSKPIRSNVHKKWPCRLAAARDAPRINPNLDIIRDADNDTISFTAAGNVIKEDPLTKEPCGRFRACNRALTIEEHGLYFRRNIEPDAGMALLRQLLRHTLQRPRIFNRSSRTDSS